MFRRLASTFVFACASMLPACSGAPAGYDVAVSDSTETPTWTLEGSPVITSSFMTPSSEGQQPVIDAINEAKSSIRMIMFHLTNPAVVTALVAAKNRGVDVEMILDQGNLADHTPTSITSPLKNAGITLIPSSTGFRITHIKSLVIDKSKALIMSINLTMDYATTRDYAVVTTDKGIIAEFLKVYAADVVNAKNGTANTPTLTDPYLAWSPVNSESRLADFVNSAKSTLIATSENLGDPAIQTAMINAVERGVNVRIISPLCDENVVPLLDLPFDSQLNAGGVTARAMPAPSSATDPYMHAKMMVVDGESAFVGSVNFSTASTTDARELGVFFKDAATIAMITTAFETDWSHAITPPPASTVTCPAIGTTTVDAGPAPTVDAGPAPTRDSGTVVTEDAATAPDAGTPTHDAAPTKEDAAKEDAGVSCKGYAAPDTSSSCNGCGNHACQNNGCYGGYYCNTETEVCASPAKACSSN